MTHAIKVSGTTVVVDLSDSIDLSCTSNLKEELERLISSEVRLVQVSAGKVEYIDSSGVACLLFIRKICSRFGTSMVFEDISPKAARVIELANLQGFLGTPKSNSLARTDVNSSVQSEPKFSDEDALNFFKK